jgi:cbb3-type cytochrome oxidase subunit 3
MKGKIIAIALCFSIVFCCGISIAYYNTKTFGFDEDAKLISKDDDKISIMDYDIYYSDLERIMDKANEIIPDEYNTMTAVTI